MVTAAHLLYALVQIAFLVLIVRLFIRDRHWTLALLAVSVAGLAYDNAIQGPGYLVGPGDTLMSLNSPASSSTP